MLSGLRCETDPRASLGSLGPPSLLVWCPAARQRPHLCSSSIHAGLWGMGQGGDQESSPGPSVGSAVLHSDGGQLLGGEQLEEALRSRWGYGRGGSASLCFSVCVRTRASAHTEFLSRIPRFLILWTVAHQAPLSREFSMQEYWSGLPFLSPGDLPDPGIEPRSPSAGRRFSVFLSHQGSPQCSQ